MIKRKAFTLIELLVVIAIIALLSSVILASLNNARTKARDSKRQQDICMIQTALELYYSNHGSYPAPSNTWVMSSDSTWSSLQSSLATYLPTLPTDPTNSATYKYSYLSHSAHHGSNYQGYYILAAYENASLRTRLEASDGVIRCNDGSVYDNAGTIEYGGNCVR